MTDQALAATLFVEAEPARERGTPGKCWVPTGMGFEFPGFRS